MSFATPPAQRVFRSLATVRVHRVFDRLRLATVRPVAVGLGGEPPLTDDE